MNRNLAISFWHFPCGNEVPAETKHLEQASGAAPGMPSTPLAPAMPRRAPWLLNFRGPALRSG